MSFSREEVSAVFFILAIVLNLYQIIDQKYFARDRMINYLIKKAKAERKCFVCTRPMQVTDE